MHSCFTDEMLRSMIFFFFYKISYHFLIKQKQSHSTVVKICQEEAIIYLLLDITALAWDNSHFLGKFYGSNSESTCTGRYKYIYFNEKSLESPFGRNAGVVLGRVTEVIPKSAFLGEISQ